MARVLERVTATIRDHDLVRSGDIVLVSCSGGPDSVCLLHALCGLRRLFRMRVRVFHFDHGLRSGAAADAAYVGRLADRLGVPFDLRAADDRPSKGDSVEAWARARRIDAARRVADEVGSGAIATGHTLDDQAETLLAWALMGDGLRAIRPKAGPVIRPLLDVSREEVEAFCRSMRLRPRRDPMNADPRFLRAALRLEAIPALERATGRAVRGPLARTARLAAEDDDELQRQTLERWDGVVQERGEWIRLRATALRALSPPIARRLVERAIGRSGAPATFADVEAILDLAAGRPGRRRDLVAGLNARREREYVLLSRTSPESRV